MTYIMTIQTDDAAHFEKIKKLAQKLGVATKEGYEDASSKSTIKGKADVEKYLLHRRRNPPVKISKVFDFDTVVDEGINL